MYDFKERGVDLEVEGVRYIEMHRGPAAYVLDPPPSRGGDLELEGGVNACHVEYVNAGADTGGVLWVLKSPPSGKIHYKLSRGGFRGGFGGYHQPLSSLYIC